MTKKEIKDEKDSSAALAKTGPHTNEVKMTICLPKSAVCNEKGESKFEFSVGPPKATGGKEVDSKNNFSPKVRGRSESKPGSLSKSRDFSTASKRTPSVASSIKSSPLAKKSLPVGSAGSDKDKKHPTSGDKKSSGSPPKDKVCDGNESSLSFSVEDIAKQLTESQSTPNKAKSKNGTDTESTGISPNNRQDSGSESRKMADSSNKSVKDRVSTKKKIDRGRKSTGKSQNVSGKGRTEKGSSQRGTNESGDILGSTRSTPVDSPSSAGRSPAIAKGKKPKQFGQIKRDIHSLGPSAGISPRSKRKAKLAKQVLRQTLGRQGLASYEMKKKMLEKERSVIASDVFQSLKLKLKKYQKQKPKSIPISHACPLGAQSFYQKCECNALRNSNTCICQPPVCIYAKSGHNPKICFCIKSFIKGNNGNSYHTKCNCLVDVQENNKEN